MAVLPVLFRVYFATVFLVAGLFVCSPISTSKADATVASVPFSGQQNAEEVSAQTTPFRTAEHDEFSSVATLPSTEFTRRHLTGESIAIPTTLLPPSGGLAGEVAANSNIQDPTTPPLLVGPSPAFLECMDLLGQKICLEYLRGSGSVSALAEAYSTNFYLSPEDGPISLVALLANVRISCGIAEGVTVFPRLVIPRVLEQLDACRVALRRLFTENPGLAGEITVVASTEEFLLDSQDIPIQEFHLHLRDNFPHDLVHRLAARTKNFPPPQSQDHLEIFYWSTILSEAKYLRKIVVNGEDIGLVLFEEEVDTGTKLVEAALKAILSVCALHSICIEELVLAYNVPTLTDSVVGLLGGQFLLGPAPSSPPDSQQTFTQSSAARAMLRTAQHDKSIPSEKHQEEESNRLQLRALSLHCQPGIYYTSPEHLHELSRGIERSSWLQHLDLSTLNEPGDDEQHPQFAEAKLTLAEALGNSESLRSIRITLSLGYTADARQRSRFLQSILDGASKNLDSLDLKCEEESSCKWEEWETAFSAWNPPQQSSLKSITLRDRGQSDFDSEFDQSLRVISEGLCPIFSRASVASSSNIQTLNIVNMYVSPASIERFSEFVKISGLATLNLQTAFSGNPKQVDESLASLLEAVEASESIKALSILSPGELMIVYPPILFGVRSRYVLASLLDFPRENTIQQRGQGTAEPTKVPKHTLRTLRVPISSNNIADRAGHTALYYTLQLLMSSQSLTELTLAGLDELQTLLKLSDIIHSKAEAVRKARNDASSDNVSPSLSFLPRLKTLFITCRGGNAMSSSHSRLARISRSRETLTLQDADRISSAMALLVRHVPSLDYLSIDWQTCSRLPLITAEDTEEQEAFATLKTNLRQLRPYFDDPPTLEWIPTEEEEEESEESF